MSGGTFCGGTAYTMTPVSQEIRSLRNSRMGKKEGRGGLKEEKERVNTKRK